jgi:hypothetical protein
MTNIYASRPYLDVVARTRFPGYRSDVRSFETEGRIYRLLTVRGPLTAFLARPVRMAPFLDMHEPVSADELSAPPRPLGWLPRVSHGMVTSEEFSSLDLARSYMAAPTVRWEAVGAWEDYIRLLRERSSLVKDDMRRARRLEDQLGAVTFAVDDHGEDVLPTCFTWKSRQTLETLGQDIFADGRNRGFFEELRRAGLLSASTLRAEGRLLAVWLGAIHGGRWYGWVFAYNRDPDLKKLSVGRLLLYRMLEESHRRGHREFDFSIGDEPYKWYFSTHARQIAPAGTPPLPLRLRRWAVTAVKSVPGIEERARSARSYLRGLRARGDTERDPRSTS